MAGDRDSSDSPASPEKNLADAVEYLEKLVDLSGVMSNVQNAMLAALTGSAMYGRVETGLDRETEDVGDIDRPDRDMPPREEPPVGERPREDTGPGLLNLFQQLLDVERHSAIMLTGIHGIMMAGGGIPGGGGGVGRTEGFYLTEREIRQQQEKEGRKPLTMLGRGLQNIGDSGRWAGRMLRKGIRRGSSVGGKIGSKIGAGGLGRLAGGAMGGIAGAVGLVTASFFEANKAVSNWTNSALDSAAKLAEVSGSMTAVMVDREVKQMMRDIQQGESTAGSAQRLVNSESDRKDAMLPVEIAMNNLQNNVLAAANELLTPIIKGVGKGIELLKQIPGVSGLLEDKKEEELPPGLASEYNDVVSALAAMEKMGADLHREAKAAAMGVAAPNGAAGPGLLPKPFPKL